MPKRKYFDTSKSVRLSTYRDQHFKHQEALQCDRCSNWQHHTCNSGITQQAYQELQALNTFEWMCNICSSQLSTVASGLSHGDATVAASGHSESAENLGNDVTVANSNSREDVGIHLADPALALPNQNIDCPDFEVISDSSYLISQATWISSPIWSVDEICIYRLATRTNNNCEGWHCQINYRAQRTGVQFYLLVQLLHEEGHLAKLNGCLLSQGALRRQQCKDQCAHQGKFFCYWQQYQTGEHSASQLLDACSCLNAP